MKSAHVARCRLLAVNKPRWIGDNLRGYGDGSMVSQRALGLTAHQIAAHRNQRLAALGPQRGDDIGRACAPIEARENRLLDLERIHQGDDVDGDRRGLAVAYGAVGTGEPLAGPSSA